MVTAMAKLIHDDCLVALKDVPGNTFDTILADPPYGIDFQSRRRAKKLEKIANDRTPFVKWLDGAYRVAKDPGCLICFHRWDVADVFKMEIESAGWRIRSQVVWDRCVRGMGYLQATFAPQHDLIWFATKGKYIFPGQRPVSVQRVPRVARPLHPNQKPILLLEQLVQFTTPSPGAVLDPFMGSGAGGMACRNLGIDYTGIELDKHYFELATDLIRKCKNRA
jgi:site-specific DNA-methyltransferase (adenine-specific)